MAFKFAMTLTVILATEIESINISYHGPFRSEASDYFQQEISNMNKTKIPQLQCGNLYESSLNLYAQQVYRDAGVYHSIPDEYKKISSYLLDSTTSDQPVKYYRFTLTSEMKAFYSTSLSLSTCCDLDSTNYNNATLKTYMTEVYHQLIFELAGKSTSDYCSIDNNSSLDTFVYLLQEKKGQINVIAQKDDSSCTNSEKSYINLWDYPEGEYIIAVGGYGTEIGNFWIHLQCVKYLWPIQTDQIDPAYNATTISCMDTKNGTVSQENPVQYLRFGITETTYFPIQIVSNDNTTKYLIESSTDINGLKEYEIMQFKDMGLATFVMDDETIYSYGEYYIMAQFPPTLDDNMTYEISIICGDPPTEYPTADPTVFPTNDPTQQPTISPTIPPKLPRAVMVGLVFGSMGTLLTLLLVYYVYNLFKYHKDKPTSPKSITKEISANKSKSKSFDKSVGFTSLDQHDESGINMIELPGTNTEQRSIVSVDLDAEDQDDINGEHEDELKIEPPRKRMNGKSIKGISIRRLDSDQELSSQMERDEDVVQAVLAHTIDCCEEEESFDIFQVLAIRQYDAHSRRVRGIKPLSKLGIDVEIIRLSPYIETLFTAVIIALAQTWGISVVVYKLVDAYFEDAADSIVCDMDVERWEDVFSLKVLALLLSLIVTFFIGVLLNGVRHNGLYEIMHRLELKHIKRVNNIGLWIVQLGQAVNYYVCCAAVLGSYFIIFRSNQSEDGDYSAAGLDMILNCVALFFMLELDDLMVSDDDYEVCGEHLRAVLNNYTPDLTINQVYGSKDNTMDNNDEDRNQTEKSIADGRSASMIEETWNKCSKFMVPFMYYFVNTFAVFTALCCYAGGFVAPFVIFFCW